MSLLNRCSKSGTILVPGLNDFRINVTYFVDENYGDDATGEVDNPARPYRTIIFPSSLAQPNSVIRVRPGTYSEGIINLRNGVTWYFEPGTILVDTYFFGSQSASILGNATFINDIATLDYTGSGQVSFEAKCVVATTDYAFNIHGTGQVFIQVEEVLGNMLRTFDTQIDVTINILNQRGDRMITIEDTSSGHVMVNIANVTNNLSGLIIQSNNVDVTYEGQSAISLGEYFIDILDNPTSIQSAINLNFVVDRLECFGFIRSVGIPTVTDPLRQPSINLHVSTIESVGNLSTRPIIDLQYTFCNFIYNRFSFSYTIPIPFIIVLGDITVLTVNGAQTLNFDQSSTSSVGFLDVNATNLAVANLNLSELFLTSRIIRTNGPSLVYFNVINMNNIVTNPGEIGIENASRIGMFIRTASIQYPDSSLFISNNNEMFIEGDSFEFESNDTIFIQNNNRMQARIGRIASNGSGNAYIRSLGLTGLNIGSMLMTGQNNTGLQVYQNRTTVNIGQIDGSSQNGNIGVEVAGVAQLIGSILVIRTLNSECLRINAIGQPVTPQSDLKFSMLSTINGSSVISIGSSSDIVLNGDSITAQSGSDIVNITNEGRVQLNLSQFNVTDCNTGIRISGGSNCLCSINIKDFNITDNANTAGIWLENGVLDIEGNYNLTSTTTSAVFLVNNVSSFRSNLGYVNATFYNLISDSFEEIWYSSKRSTTQNGSNVLLNLVNPPNPNSNINLDGQFISATASNFRFTGGFNPGITRVLNPYLLGSGASIDAGGNPALNFFCNFGVANSPLVNASVTPAGSFVVAGIQ